jgi:hypothetical protein
VLLAAVIVLGVTSGALVTEGAVLVPFWRALAPAEFLAWYRRHAALLFRFFGSLEIVAALATLGALAVRWHATGALDVWLGGAAALCIAVLLVFPAYFQHVNERFERGTIAADDVGPELARWARWHWLRTAMALGAFVAALMAHGTRSAGA